MSVTLAPHLVNIVGRLICVGGFLWLGLYVLAPGWGRRIATLTAITMIATACYFLTNAWFLAPAVGSEAVAIRRLMWWATVAPNPLWLHLSLELNPRLAGARWRLPVIWLSYGAAAICILLGTATDAIENYSPALSLAPLSDSASWADYVKSVGGIVPVTIPGPGYALCATYLIACMGGAVASFAHMACRASRPGTTADSRYSAVEPGVDAVPTTPANPGQRTMEIGSAEVWLLAVGTLCLALSLCFRIEQFVLHRGLGWTSLPSVILPVVGFGLLGASVAIQSALLVGLDVRRDFLHGLIGLAAVLLPSVIAIWQWVGLNLTHRLFAVLAVALIASTHALHDVWQGWLDAVFFSAATRRQRSVARAYTETLAMPPAGAHPDLATTKAFDDVVRRALADLSDPTKLVTTPLLNLAAVAKEVRAEGLEDNRLNRAAALRELLLELLDALKSPTVPGTAADEARRFYNCLYIPYVMGINRRRAPSVLRQLEERRRREGGPRGELEHILDWFSQIDDASLYRWQRRASDTIAAALRERERASGGATPLTQPA